MCPPPAVQVDDLNSSILYVLQGIVCAEVTRIAKHPIADRLRVCQLSLGGKSVQVWGAPTLYDVGVPRIMLVLAA